jgi:hypothetical protein
MKHRKIYAAKEGGHISLDEALEHVDKDEMLYIQDIDGIENNRPNLCTFPKLSEHRDIWVDTGPRVLGDIVDIVMTGASRITIRKNLFRMDEYPSIKEIAESLLFIHIDTQQNSESDKELLFLPGVNGFVMSNEKSKIERDYRAFELIKMMVNKYNVYVATPNSAHLNFWKDKGITGILLDIENMKQVKYRGF